MHRCVPAGADDADVMPGVRPTVMASAALGGGIAGRPVFGGGLCVQIDRCEECQLVAAACVVHPNVIVG